MTYPLEATVEHVANRQLDHGPSGVCENEVCKTGAVGSDNELGMLEQSDLVYQWQFFEVDDRKSGTGQEGLKFMFIGEWST